MDLANPGYMGQAAELTNVYPDIQRALLGQQHIQSNDLALQQQRQQMAEAQNAQMVAERRRQQMQGDFTGLMKDANPQTVGRFIMAYPEFSEPITKGWQMMSEGQKAAALKASADVKGYLDAGDASGAISILQTHMDAAGKTGEDVSSYPKLIQTIRENPEAARALAAVNFAIGAGPEKMGETYAKVSETDRANQLQPAAMQEAAAKASIATTEAQYKPKVIESDLQTEAQQRQRMRDQTANEQADIAIKRSALDLDRDKLTSDIQMKLEEMDRSGTQVDAGGRQAINTAVGESTSASALAERMDGLASRMVGVAMPSGWTAWASENLKDATGGQNPVSAIRSEYQQIVNSQAVKNLPPGPASDKDIALAKQGFPPANASPQYVHDWLRGVAKMQRAVAAAADRKGNWIAENGSLAPARRDINVGGVTIPAGTTFQEFNGNAVKRSKQGQTPPGLDAIYQKYGTR